MRLTSHTDYALRVLIYVAAAGDTVTIKRISEAYSISREHLRKVVHELAQMGYLQTSQGRYGGIRLARLPETINIRTVVEQLENTALAECFDDSGGDCAINGMCTLKTALLTARESFMQSLQTFYLSDLIKNPQLIAFCRQ